MNQLLSAMGTTNNATTTKNGDMAFKSTTSAVLDFFASGSALRGQSAKHQVDLFVSAWMEDPNLAIKTMFYARDVRQGQGQRGAFREQLKYLGQNHPDIASRLVSVIPEFGRWDDLYSLFGTKAEDSAMAHITNQLRKDMTGGAEPSLMAKWLKSENAHSKETKRLATITRRALRMNSKTYRKVLSGLRARLNLIETKMTEGDWSGIDYAKLPSMAMMKYRAAFARNDGARFSEYIGKVTSGEEKINSGVLYPYDIIEKIGVFNYFQNESQIDPALAQVMWDNLPNYLEDAPENFNAITVVDTSGSMRGAPINVAVSLGLYFAERDKGAFKNHLISFSDNPTLVKVEGGRLADKVRHIGSFPWGMTTNLEAVFSLILKSAIDNEVPHRDMPNKIFIVSDMQFNRCVTSHESVFECFKDRFAQHGYNLPDIVFWNVNAQVGKQPVTMNEQGVQLVSGLSPSIFKNIMGAELETPMDLMMNVLNGERYNILNVV